MFRHNIPVFVCVALTVLFLFSNIAEAQRSCRVLFLGNRKEAPNELILYDGKTFQTVELPTMNLSPVYTIAGGEISLRLLEEQPVNPGEISSGAPGVKLSESAGDFYLLVSNDRGNKVLPLSMKFVDADYSSFRMGEMLWFNLTKNRIGGKLGDQKLDLKPNARLISKAPTSKAGNFPVELYYQIPGDKDVWPLCETKWIHNPNGRVVMFVLPEEGVRVPRLMGFPDFRKEEKKGG